MGKERARILIVDDEPIKRSILEDELRDAGYSVTTATNPLEAEPLLAKGVFHIILTDLRMPGQDGLSFLRQLRRERPEQAVIVMTAYGTVATAVEAMKLGAFDYLQKPFSTAELLLRLDKLLRYEHLTSENETLRQQLAAADIGRRIVGQSEGMRNVMARVRAVASLDTTVLVEGESGTGKELVARQIHEASHRAAAPFVAVTCAALPRELVESELFGHEPGAFTGAAKLRLGRFECAHGGTLFLDDVDDIPMEVQVKLLRVLQERTIERLGGMSPVRVNVRVIAATKKSLAALVATGKFREDLYYRLSVVPLHIPPLRERPDDVPALVEHFLEQLALKMNRHKLTLTSRAVVKLQAYGWPGNVRQLEHTLEQMIAVNDKTAFDVGDLPVLEAPEGAAKMVSLSLGGVSSVDMAAVVADVEERLIRWALNRAQGNLAQTAELLKIPRSTLQYKIRKLADGTGDPAEDSKEGR